MLDTSIIVLAIIVFVFITPYVAKFSGDPRFLNFSFDSVKNMSNLNTLFWLMKLPYIVLLSNWQ